jgi:succinylarginine dihydrolase
MEINYDGLVGLSHNYAGLSYGNVASMGNKALLSNPREAALQGLTKMKSLMERGYKQGVFAPQERPDIAALRGLGFSGSEAQVLESAFKKAPEMFAACCSASSMWTANAATTCGSLDASDTKVHFTAANLANKFHRAIEHPTTTRLLKSMFKGEAFAHHPALPSSGTTGDEGAANHTRFFAKDNEPGFHFFVYGIVALQDGSGPKPERFPARHSLEASEAIARQHALSPSHTFFTQQNPLVIDSGAFHNDVVSVGNKNVLFYHELSFLDPSAVQKLSTKFKAACGVDLIGVMVKDTEVPIKDAVKSYLFNSQLLTRPDGKMCLVAPTDCQTTPSVKAYLDKLLASKAAISEVLYFNLRQSMQNGGGPACLRFRVELREKELAQANQSCLMTPALFTKLEIWVNKHYRDRLELKDLADPKFLLEGRQALDELTQILSLGAVYPFQL